MKRIKKTKQENFLNEYKEVNDITESNFISKIKKRATNFLKNTAKKVKRNARKVWNELKKKFNQTKSKSTFVPGSLVAMSYDAKFKNQTRWDKKPLIICLGWSQNPKYKTKNFYGLNIHHLPMKDRVNVATFFLELLERRGGKLEYKDVKPFMNKFKGSPVLRQYIYARVHGKVIKMPPDLYLTAASVPSELMVNG